MNAKELKDMIRPMLESSDLDSLGQLPTIPAKTVKHLLSMTYDKSDLVTWRAIEGIGALTAKMEPDEGREVIMKFVWMMRDESGGNLWCGPEIVGEILRLRHEPYADIVPVLVSFSEEIFFAPGVLWAMARIARDKPDLMEPFSAVARRYLGSASLGSASLGSASPYERAMATLTLLNLPPSGPRLINSATHLLKDTAGVTFYENGLLLSTTVRDLALRAAHKE